MGCSSHLRLLRLTLAIGAGASVAGCLPSPAPTPPADPSLSCADFAAPTALTAQRTVAFPQNHISFDFPATVAIHEAARVEAAVTALCSLPPAGDGPEACPADLGVSYRLTFAGNAAPPAVVAVEAGGCELVSGVGTTMRSASAAPAFWAILGSALGLRDASYEEFSGSAPS